MFFKTDCALGSLTPETLNCGYIAASRKSRDDDSSSIIVLDGANVTSSEDENDGRDCGPPGKIHGSLVYKNGEQIDDSEEGFHSGTEITFDCIASITGEQTTWKIICEDGLWIGRSMNCGKQRKHLKKLHTRKGCPTHIYFAHRGRRPGVPQDSVRERIVRVPEQRAARGQLLQRSRDKRGYRGVSTDDNHHIQVSLVVFRTDGDADFARQYVRFVVPLVGVEDDWKGSKLGLKLNHGNF